VQQAYSAMALTNNETYVKLQLLNDESSSSRKDPQNLFVKGTWYPRHFFMSVLDGCDTWTLHGTSSHHLERPLP
jgi:hypothetical protein